MAKKKAQPPTIQFELTDEDDMFDDEESIKEAPSDTETLDADAAEGTTADPDHADDPAIVPSAEPALDHADLPPSHEPMDPGYIIAQQQQRLDELEALLRSQPKPRDEAFEREEARIAELGNKKRQSQQAYLAAIEAGDERARAAAMFDRDEASEELQELKQQRSVREMRALREQGATVVPDPQARQRTQQIEVATFRSAYRVTPEEETAMERAWPEFVKKNPAWGNPQIRTWHVMTKALGLVRTGKRSTQSAGGAAMAEGGQHSAPSKRTGSAGRHGRDGLHRAARQFGTDGATYQKLLDGKLSVDQQKTLMRKAGLL